MLLQSTRMAAYRAAAGRLEAQGLLYRCFATRTEIETAAAGAGTDPDGAPLYPGLWKGRSEPDIAEALATGRPYALRLDMAAAMRAAADILNGRHLDFVELGDDDTPRTVEARPQRWGDAVIVRKDVATSYHLAVVVDDAWQGVTHVTRGRDLFAATDLHRLLQVLLGLPAARLSPSPADRRRRRPQALQERTRHQPAVAAGAGSHARRDPAPGRARLIFLFTALFFSLRSSQTPRLSYTSFIGTH